MIRQKSKYFWIGIALTVSLLGFSIPYAYAKLHLGYSAAERKTAADLASLSGLPADMVFDLYDADGSWESVKQNILIYRTILDTMPANGSQNQIVDLAEKYEARDILAVVQFAAKYQRNAGVVEDILAKHAEGKNLEDLFAAEITNHEYANYHPADKEEIRQWLAAGLTPEDIIQADTIAIAKDMKLQTVIEMKRDDVSWEEIGKKLHFMTEKAEAQAQITLPAANGPETLSAPDYESLIQKANQSADQNQQKAIEELSVKLGTKPEKINALIQKGYHRGEIINAYHLAEKAGTTPDKVLSERAAGKTWTVIVKKYDRERKAAQ